MMPIPSVNSKEDIGECVKFLMDEGYPQKQALAICYKKLRENVIEEAVEDIINIFEVKVKEPEGYISSIKNKDKKEYAEKWFKYRKKKGKKPEPKNISVMAAQAVRMNIDTLGGFGK